MGNAQEMVEKQEEQEEGVGDGEEEEQSGGEVRAPLGQEGSAGHLTEAS